MIRVALLLLALPSLLMPPGVCVCQYARATPSAVTPTAAVVEEPEHRTGGCCKKCCGTTNKAAPEVDSTYQPAPPAPLSPTNREHDPNCPAVTPTAAVMPAEPPVVLSELQFAAVDDLVNATTEPTVHRVACADSPSPPTPRYITFRSLLR